MENRDQLKEEFSRYVKSNMRRAYYTALGFLGNHEDAVEASQLAFIKAYRNFNKFDRNRQFFTWYYKILKNLCLNILRDNKRKFKLEAFESQKESNDNSTFEDYETLELKEKLQEALFSLNAADRGIVILKEYENFSYKEIAEILEIPIGTVMSRLFYTRKKLAEKLKELI